MILRLVMTQNISNNHLRLFVSDNPYIKHLQIILEETPHEISREIIERSMEEFPIIS